MEDEDLKVEEWPGPTVNELHIDFLLEEEFRADPNFLLKFIEAAGHGDTSAHIEDDGVKRSVSDEFGEADLIVLYKHLEGAAEKPIAILIEDKIDAPLQPRQAERYRERGESGNGTRWNRYWTCREPLERTGT